MTVGSSPIFHAIMRVVSCRRPMRAGDNRFPGASRFMTRVSAMLVLGTVSALAADHEAGGSALRLWYPQPATAWVEALPVGNGRQGAMIFAGIDKEHLQLNDITIWSGKPEPESDRLDAYKNLPEIRKLLREGRFADAEVLTKATMTNGGEPRLYYRASYQTLGNLDLTFAGLKAETASGYRRWLDLDRAVSGVEFTIDGVRYRREVFASAVDKAIVIHLTCSRPGGLTFTSELSRITGATTTAPGPDTLLMQGSPSMPPENPEGQSLPGYMHFEAQVRIVTKGGACTADAGHLTVTGADEATVFVVSGSDYVLDPAAGYKGADPHAAVSTLLARTAAKPYDELLATHVTDYQRLFQRVELDLGADPKPDLPTDQRLQAYGDGTKDPAFAALFFAYGRYLLISSSRPDSPLPANAQGLWGDGLRLPWQGDYKLNINTQMNYWPAGMDNLSECQEPLLRLIASLVGPGSKTAKAYYDAPGWLCQFTTNAWGWTSAGSRLPFGVSTSGSGWLLQHLWSHFAFTRDRDYLAKAYPVMRGACEFYLHILIEDAQGFLITAPSTSPENRFVPGPGFADANTPCAVDAGSAFEREVIWDAFSNTIQAATVLGIDPEFRTSLAVARSRLHPLQIGKAGQLQEWSGDWDLNSQEMHHRHPSHLFALHPGNQISLGTTPALAEACRKSLELRTDDGTGWSKAWKINLWSRLAEGDHAHRLLSDQLQLVSAQATDYVNGGGTYPNLFDAHPPFQIDGNFGATAGMTEMLLQSQVTYRDQRAPAEDRYLLQLLPALPSTWAHGSVRGLRARGGFGVDLRWAAGSLVQASIHSVGGTDCKLSLGKHTIDLHLAPGASVTLDHELKETSPAP